MGRKKKEFIRFKEVSCPVLNVRSNPSTDSLVTKMIARGTIVECDKNFNDDEWDHIITDPNVEGYCMKKFLQTLSPDTIAALGSSPILIHTHNYTCESNNVEDNKDDVKETEK